MTLKKLIYLLAFILMALSLPYTAYTAQAATKTYTITTKTEASDKYKKAKAYNSTTKDYYVFRTVFDKCTDNGGGKIVIKKGTYVITKPVYISSNTTVILEDGVILKKSSEGTKSIFHFVSYKNASKENYYSSYTGEHDISIIGEGNVTIDNDYFYRGVCIVVGHNTNVTIKNIHFTNMNAGHFIEMDASQNVLIDGCTFENAKAWGMGFKEAINIDTPDLKTKGFNCIWSSHDKTPDLNVHITNCTFKNLESGIGTHGVSKGYNESTGLYDITMWHTNIVIDYCEFINISRTCLRVYAWKDAVVSNNKFTNSAEIKGADSIFEGWCTDNFTFKLNTMYNFGRIGVINAINYYSINRATGEYIKVPDQDYEPNYSYVYEQNIKDFYNNTATNMNDATIFIAKTITNDTLSKNLTINGSEMKIN